MGESKRRDYKKYLPISPEIARDVLLPQLDEAANEYRAARQRRDEIFDSLEAAEQDVKRLTDELYSEITGC